VAIGLAFFWFSETSLSQQTPMQMQTAGGTLTWGFNQDVMTPLAMSLDTSSFITARFTPAHAGRYATLITHIAQTSSMNLTRIGQHIEGINGGVIELHDGPQFLIPGGKVDLRQARLKAENPPSFALTIYDRDGKTWASLDHPHYDLAAANREFWMKDFDLHIGPALAAALGNQALTGEVIGSASLSLPIISERALQPSPSTISQSCTIDWPGPTGHVDLQMILLDHDPALGGLMDSITVMRCGIPTASGYKPCTPTSSDGLVVMAPDAAVKNIGATAIAWHPMFSAPGPPYNNDQHPFLVWNLYRIDGDGTFHQIGRSGVKHAYYADNFSCPCSAQSAAYPQCEETYAAGTNDMPNVLGPRKEVIPARGQWGRCGSIFDPECSGRLDSHYFEHDDGYHNRMAVRERDLLSASNPSAKYLFEYEYIVRGQLDFEHATAHRWAIPAKSVTKGGIRWSMTPTSFANGPAINEWVHPLHPASGSMNIRISTPDGHFRVAVRTTKLSRGRYRYDYAVLNEDFARAITSGVDPNLRIVSTGGFDQFEIPVLDASAVDDVEFMEGDEDSSHNWTSSLRPDALAWQAPAETSLEWGDMYTFSLTAAVKPARGQAVLHVAQPGKLGTYSVETLVPTGASPPLKMHPRVSTSQ
jgi:hypothetical protein